MTLEPSLESFVAVDRDGDSDAVAGLAVDVMAAVDAETPAMTFQHAAESLTGE